MRSKRPIPPHRILVNDDVILAHEDSWRLEWEGHDEAVVANGGIIEGWEPGINIRARNTVQLAPSAYHRLGAEAASGMRLHVVAIASTAGGLQVVTKAKHSLSLGGEPVELDLVFDGHRLARSIQLHLGIVVARPAEAGDRLMPALVGARLWGSDWRSRIEGGRARLAIEAVDFSKYFASTRMADALVHVVVAEDPSLDVEQGLTVYLNSNAPGFVQEVARREPRASAILWDAVIRRVAIVGSDFRFSLTEEYPTGSVGKQWQAWTMSTFPGKTTDQLLSMHRSDTSTFEAQVQSWVHMGTSFAAKGGGQ